MREAVAMHCDISSRSSIQEVVAKIKHIDILINNAGISQSKDFLDITDEDWNQMININLRGAFICSQEVIPSMLNRNWGRIINITSIGGQWGGINQVLCFIKSWPHRPFNVSCQTLQRKRNYIKLNFAGYHRNRDDFLDQNEDKQILTQDIPVGRFGLVEEVAEVVSFLASDIWLHYRTNN